MGVLVLVDDPGVLELDVQVLIDGVEDALDSQVILQLHRHLLPHQFLEVREEELPRCTTAQPPANEGRNVKKSRDPKNPRDHQRNTGSHELPSSGAHFPLPLAALPRFLRTGGERHAGKQRRGFTNFVCHTVCLYKNPTSLLKHPETKPSCVKGRSFEAALSTYIHHHLLIFPYLLRIFNPPNAGG